MANRVLIITGDSVDARILESVLGNAREDPFAVELVSRLSDALKRLKIGDIEAILVDLTLPDSQGIETFDKLHAIAPDTPILTLNAAIDGILAADAVQHGSQGDLAKVDFGNELVPQSLHNIILRKTIEQVLFIEKTRAEITLNSISDAVIGTDMVGNIDYLNLAAENMTGWSRQEARGLPIGKVMRTINKITRKSEKSLVEQVLKFNKPVKSTPGAILIRRDGQEAIIENSCAPINDWHGRTTGAVIVFRDITAAQAMAHKMAHLAQHDFLTNLPNRVLLSDRIEHAIALAKRQGAQLAVFFLDLDNFKHINDSLGHTIGDKLLQSVASSLIGCVRSSDTVSRQGGDEFLILVREDAQGQNAALIAEKILTALTQPHTIAKHELHITTSIGISIYPTDGQDAETLIKNADTAMYQAKDKGRNNYQFFQREMNTRAMERQVIEAHLHLALARQEFVLHYQPKVNLSTTAITGAEVLLRWVQPELGMVMPERFIKIAESCGLIVPIGRWVLQQACAQVLRWDEAGLKSESIAVNISAPEFRSPGFVDSVRSTLKTTGLAPGRLQLEITESVLMRDVESSATILNQLKTMGVKLAVDDFGTGYSSLSYLRQFPIDVLKIDQSFVQNIGASDGDGVIVSAILAMSTSLKLQVIAEGVEEQDQLDFLRAQHCDEGQGYFFHQPITAKEFTDLLTTGMSRNTWQSIRAKTETV